MAEELFGDLVATMQKAIAATHAEQAAPEHGGPDVRALRESLGLSCEDFARLLQVDCSTLENWEEKRQTPRGPAGALLKVLAAAPGTVLDILK